MPLLGWHGAVEPRDRKLGPAEYLGSFRGWLYRLRRERAHGKVARSATRMVPVHVRAGGEPSDDVIEIAIPGVVLRVRAGVDVKYVAELAAALTRRC